MIRNVVRSLRRDNEVGDGVKIELGLVVVRYGRDQVIGE